MAALTSLIDIGLMEKGGKVTVKGTGKTASSPTKSPSSGLHKPTWRPSSKPNEHRQLSEKTASSISQAAKNAIYGLSGPTKSPSTGLHKPTWKPTPGTPTGKPLEHRRLANDHPGDLTTSTAGKGAFAEVGPSKSPSTGIHKPTWKPTQGKPSGKPVEPWKEGVESSHTEMKNSAHTDGEIVKEHSKRELKGDVSPTKSPSSGVHKPTWRPSSKPNESKNDVGVDVVSDIGAALPRRLAEKTASSVSQAAKNAIYGLSGPTKSPSTGLHKPTWKPTPGTPTGKPLEHRGLRQLLGHHAARDAANDAKHDNDKLSKKESKKIIEKKVDQLDKKAALKKAALSTKKDKVSADRQLKSLKDKKEELKAFQAAALADSEDAPSIYSESEVDPSVSFSAKFATSATTTNKSERESKKSDAKLKAKVVEEESSKASKGEVKQTLLKAAALQATELKGTIKSLELKTAAKEASKSSKKEETVVVELNSLQGEQKKMAKWLAKAYEAISSSTTARSMLADKLHTPSSVGVEKETSVSPPSTATIIANSQAGQFLRSKNTEAAEVIVDESVGAPVLLVDESVVMTSSSSSTTPDATTTTTEVEEEEVVEMDEKTTKKLAILEKKLSKAQKKGDDEDAAKIEKKIAKLTPTTSTSSAAEVMESSAAGATTATTPSVEELLAKIDELEYDAKMDAFFSGEDKAATVKKTGGATAAKTTTATTAAVVAPVAAAVPVVEEVPVVLMSSAAPGAYMSGTIADVEGGWDI